MLRSEVKTNQAAAIGVSALSVFVAAIRIVAFLVLGALMASVNPLAHSGLLIWAVVNALGLEVLWGFNGRRDVLPSRLVGIYVGLLAVAAVLTATSAYAVPYKVCDPLWRLLGWC